MADVEAVVAEVEAVVAWRAREGLVLGEVTASEEEFGAAGEEGGELGRVGWLVVNEGPAAVVGVAKWTGRWPPDGAGRRAVRYFRRPRTS